MARLATRFGRKSIYFSALVAGGLGLISIIFVKDQYGLIASMVGVGIAWAAILAMPYAMLASSIPPRKMGMYMGLFNMSITIPQIVSGILSGFILKYLFADNPILCIIMAGASMFLGAISALFIKEKTVL